ncbi:MAG TPA: extracellular solute-binding protein [Ktedonobacteraceae bacterium]|nr:extracellular solute-binding protein [Ktedonobacteraceae bacterium]
MEKDFQRILDRMTKAGLDVDKMPRRDFVKVAAGMVGLSATLAACGGSGGNSGPALQQWYHQYGEAGTQQAVFKYAKGYTKANVKVQWTAGDFGTKLSAALVAPGGGPDIYEGGPSLAAVKANQITDLSDLYTPDVKSDYTDTILNSLTVNGKIYGVKMVTDTGVLYYRKSMLQKAGVQPPTTFDEVIAAAKQLTSGNVKGIFVGNDGGIGALQGLALWSAGHGNDFIVNNKIAFDNDRTALAFTKMRELAKSNAVLLGSPTDWFDPSAFTQGLAAMQWTGLWAMPAIIKALGDDFDVVPWPALDSQGIPTTFLGGWAEMVNGKSKYIDQAKAFVKWLWIDNVADQQDFNLDYGFHVPPRKSIAAKATKLQSGPAAKAVQYLDQYARYTSPLWDANMATALNNAVSNIVKNGADAKTEVHNAAQQANAELQKILS